MPNGFPPHPEEQLMHLHQQQQTQQQLQMQQNLQSPQQEIGGLMVVHQTAIFGNPNNGKDAAAANIINNNNGVGPCHNNANNNNKEAPQKTPVSLLQEALSRRGITPVYELVQIEGAIHEPTFRYRVSFNDKDAMGAGKSKKEAKHAAARALIEKLADCKPFPAPASVQAQQAQIAQIAEAVRPDAEADAGDGDGGAGSDDQIAGNPIGWLQEQCMLRRWPPPIYETEMEVGLPHQRQFTIACVVLKLREIGQGKSKKIAKRLAAHKLWSRLVDSPPESAANAAEQCLEELANGEEQRVATNRFDDLKEANIPALTNQNSFKVSQFHRAMKASSGPNIAQLQRSCLRDPQLNHVQFLHEIAVEHQFEVTYVDIDERTYGGQHQCFVQLSTMPVAVVTGQGASFPDAQMDAAHNALQYLRIMTKV